MTEVVICDTNTVIQLAIICPECLKITDKALRLVVHSIVRQEIHVLRKDADKEKRIGKVLEFIQKEIPADSKAHLPGKKKEIELHRMIQHIERGLPVDLMSAGSSPNDRKFLMLAKGNNAHLLTNERTLYNLGKAFLKDQETWRVGETIEKIQSLKIVSDEDLQLGINKLSEYEEFLSSQYAKKVRALGFKYE